MRFAEQPNIFEATKLVPNATIDAMALQSKRALIDPAPLIKATSGDRRSQSLRTHK